MALGPGFLPTAGPARQGLMRSCLPFLQGPSHCFHGKKPRSGSLLPRGSTYVPPLGQAPFLGQSSHGELWDVSPEPEASQSSGTMMARPGCCPGHRGWLKADRGWGHLHSIYVALSTPTDYPFTLVITLPSRPGRDLHPGAVFPPMGGRAWRSGPCCAETPPSLPWPQSLRGGQALRGLTGSLF